MEKCLNTCIIGAGTAGLCAARHALKNKINVKIFEQNNDVGGTWIYTDEVGQTKNGIDVHSSMYKNLRTNLPKEIMGFPDYPITCSTESYIESEEMLNFLKSYARDFNITNLIHYNHQVIRISPRGKKWQVLVKNLNNGIMTEELFDTVLICNGHYNTPYIPVIRGINNFKGKALHSHDYRESGPYKDDDILIIGAGPSGMDMCNEISKVARSVFLSQHLPDKPKTKFLDNVSLKPDVFCLEENGVLFKDGTYQDITTVLFCTGYKYSFPFLSINCGIATENNYIRPLYKHCVNILHPTMAFIGLPFYVCAAQMIDLQLRFLMKFWNGDKQFPQKSEMLIDTRKEMLLRWTSGLKKRQAHMMGPDQFKYYNDLANTAEIEGIPPVMTKIHNESSERFLDDLINFRMDKFVILNNEDFLIYEK